ncbi:hypothetical protein GF318_03915 [Candidatus Micrarchaeota archaeon]|nr:hypothetical protein [Candidatus Micrarchaeota archaeon]
MSALTSAAGMAAAVLGFIAFIPYVISILKGKSAPNRATWWIWTFLGVIISASYFSVGATDSALVTISFVVGPFITALLSLKYGEGGWNRFDASCVAGALLGALLWWLFSAPVIALVLTIFIDGMGLLPTVKKAYFRPQSEDSLAWALFFVSALLNLFAIEQWSFEVAVYPVYIFLLESTVLLLLLRPKLEKRLFIL